MGCVANPKYFGSTTLLPPFGWGELTAGPWAQRLDSRSRAPGFNQLQLLSTADRLLSDRIY